MGLESTARAWAQQAGLQRLPPVVADYRALVRFRFRHAWAPDVEFRGHRVFALYRAGEWYEAASSRKVAAHVDVCSLARHACALILPPAEPGKGS